MVGNNDSLLLFVMVMGLMVGQKGTKWHEDTKMHSDNGD